jgi:hypothetical protein
MNELTQWAVKHGVSQAALADLIDMVTVPELSVSISGQSEAAVQNNVRLEASLNGVKLSRNNVGACKDERGRLIRYGLDNESKSVNTRFKSSDLIGIRKLLITQSMVGSHVGQFVAREVKAGDWKWRGTDREVAQLRYLMWVLSMGGDASFANGVGTL